MHPYVNIRSHLLKLSTEERRAFSGLASPPIALGSAAIGVGARGQSLSATPSPFFLIDFEDYNVTLNLKAAPHLRG